MQCPRDGETLQKQQVRGVTIEVCPADGGMYLERGELNRVAEPTAGDLEFSTVDRDTFDHDDGMALIQCPADPDVTMQKVEFNVETNIILDYCERCRGFWLDGKELARINEQVSELNAATASVPDPPMVRLSEFFWNLPFPK
jgi:Zn-finger nucleic acid-binding protein